MSIVSGSHGESGDMNLSIIIPAAGSSTRFGNRDKLREEIGGRPLLERTIETFAASAAVNQIIVVGPPDDLPEFRERFGPALSFHGVQIVPGGRESRWQSVAAGLKAVSENATHIGVHDAARPGLTEGLLNRLLETALYVDAVIPVLKVNATVKRVGQLEDVGGREDELEVLADSILGGSSDSSIKAAAIEETVDRTGLVLAQTPQVFKAALLHRAYSEGHAQDTTDDAQAVERAGARVYTIDGEARNLKVTTRADVDLVISLMGLKPDAQRPTHKRF